MRNGEINKNHKQIDVGHLSYISTLKLDDRHNIYILKKSTYKKYRHSIICIIKTSFT